MPMTPLGDKRIGQVGVRIVRRNRDSPKSAGHTGFGDFHQETGLRIQKCWLGVWTFFSIYWECHHPNWTHIFQRGWLKPHHQPEMSCPTFCWAPGKHGRWNPLSFSSTSRWPSLCNQAVPGFFIETVVMGRLPFKHWPSFGGFLKLG